MPANLTPDYEKAEQRYRQAATDEERLEALRQMYATIPKHKGTEKLQADIKRRISQLRKAQARKPARGPDPYHIPPAGAGQVVLVGPPNTGKSALVARLTEAPVKVAEYPFSTAVPVPGMCRWLDVQIELVDTPPVVPEHVPGGLINLLRNCDVIAVVVDAAGPCLELAQSTLELLEQRRILLRSVPRNQSDPTSMEEHSGLILANRIDLSTEAPQTAQALADLYDGRLQVLPVSAHTGEGLDRMVQRFWELLAVIRVYTKEPGKPPDRNKPFILEQGATVEDLARLIHRELPEKMRFARIWGDGRFPGQQVHRSEPLRDADTVEIHE